MFMFFANYPIRRFIDPISITVTKKNVMGVFRPERTISALTGEYFHIRMVLF